MGFCVCALKVAGTLPVELCFTSHARTLSIRTHHQHWNTLSHLPSVLQTVNEFIFNLFWKLKNHFFGGVHFSSAEVLGV